MSRDFDALRSWLALNGWRVCYLAENRPGLWLARLTNDQDESPVYSRDTPWAAIRECMKKVGIKPMPANYARLETALSELTSELESPRHGH